MEQVAERPIRWLKVLDQTRCIGCHACTTACKSENEVPVGVTRTYVKSVDVGTFPQARRAFQVTRCNQCTDAPCVTACPTEAMYKRPDGIVDFDKDICIGCKACMAWITEGIRPGVVACSHHMGRWRTTEQSGGAGGMMATVDLQRDADDWSMRRVKSVQPYASSDPDTQRIWWSDTGVHQNLTFPVHPDPISGMHCWHQAVRVVPAGPQDRAGDISVDTAKAREVYAQWLTMTRPAGQASPRACADRPG